MLRVLFFLLIKFILGAESGASFPWSSKWQSKTIFGHTLQQLPEAIDALLLAFIAVQGYEALGLDLPFYQTLVVYISVFAIIYAGIQSATWLFLQWEGHNDPDTDRKSTLKPIVDFISEKLGFKLGDEGYSWVAATVKGTIITLPMGGLGGILFALGYEAGSHFKKDKYNKYLPFNPHIISEGLSFVGIGIYALLFLTFCEALGN